MASVRDLAIAERSDLADYLETLSPEEWLKPSLCPGWSVRDVVGHVVSYDVLNWPSFLATFARSGFSLGRSNEVGVRDSRQLRADELVARLRGHLSPRGITAAFGCRIALTDGLIHHQDIRRALEHPRTVPPERLAAALQFAPRARALPAPTNLRGLRAVATDLDWAYGSGPEVRGQAEALLIALAGRPQGLAHLEGPGLEILAARVQ